MASYLEPWAFTALFTAFKKFYDNFEVRHPRCVSEITKYKVHIKI
jgi:hypothetical protein